jgi:hypothetical protein
MKGFVSPKDKKQPMIINPNCITMKGFVSPKDKKQPMIINPNSHGIGVLTCVADPDSVSPDPDPD